MKNSRICHIAVATLFAATAPVVSAAAGFAWFDKTSPPGFGAEVWTPNYAAFSVEVARSVEGSDELYPDALRGRDARLTTNTLRFFTAIERDSLNGETSRFADPHAEGLFGYRSRQFGIAWQHRLDDMNQFTVSAGHGAVTPLFAPTSDLTDTRATVSLTSRWQAAYRPRVTGSVFVGGESTLPESHRTLGRRYYGLAVGGELSLSRAHTPYVSFQMQRSLSSGEEALAASLSDDDRSQIAAGWKWKAQRYLSLQAEASLGYNGGRLRFQNPEHTRVFFGTRFDFQ